MEEDNSLIKKIFEPSRKVKTFLILGIVFIIALAGASYIYPKGYNNVVEKVGLGLPHIEERGFSLGLDLQGGTHLVYQADLSNVKDDDKKDSMEGVREVIDKRVNALGVAEPDIRIAGPNRDRLNIELAGVLDVNEAIDLIGKTPLLEFKELPEEDEEDEEGSIEENARKRAENILEEVLAEGADFEEIARRASEDPGSAEAGGVLGFKGRGAMLPEYEKAIFDDLDVGEISKELVQSDYGFHIIEKLEERTIPPDAVEVNSRHILISTGNTEANLNWINTELSGKHVNDAQVSRDQQSTEISVTLYFNNEGKDIFEELTERNVGEPVAIFLDGNIISAPTVQQVIVGGQAAITGNFSLEEGQELARNIRAGALPVPINLVSQQTIGPTLGAESIESSLTAGMWGLLAVMIFMILYYRLPGVLAAISLIFYGILVLAIFKVAAITLTLAGIAGFILSIGMAVDANVLVFSRLSEELHFGKPLESAIDDAFERAWPSIRDGNVSTLITCVILFQFSTSLVQGFAVTLGIGVLISMFSALVVTKRLLRAIASFQTLTRTSLYKVK